MINKKIIALAIVSVVSITLIFLMIIIANYNIELVEKYYSRGFYIFFSSVLNSISNVFPFSLSEMFIGVQVLYIFYLFIQIVLKIVYKQYKYVVLKVVSIICILSLNLLFFELSWGLNNYRHDVETLFELDEDDIKLEDLYESYKFLIIEANRLREEINSEYELEELQLNAYKGYENMSKKYSFISPKKVVVKLLIISPLFSKSGYTGIYLPYFSEANINKMAPIIGLAFTASHEIAHQKGFSSEDEANFIGLLSCYYHDDIYYRYSAYLAMQSYVGNSLFSNNKELYYELADLRSEKVLNDIDNKKQFWDEHIVERNKEVHDQINDTFLKVNNQPDGIINYSKVTELFVKAFKKNMFESFETLTSNE